jgi:nucleoside phosphorylase
MVVAKAILDEEHNVLLAADPSDTNSYLLGRIGSHNVVLACLPSGKLGTGLAALVVKDMLRSFEYIRFGLMVGIGGGVPNANMEDPDIRLGDVVISHPSKKSDAVVQYDFGTSEQGGRFIRTNNLNKPPDVVLGAVARMKANDRLIGHNLTGHLSKMLEKYPRLRPDFENPGPSNDYLFKSSYIHVNSKKTCEECCSTIESNLVPRSARTNNSPILHYGTIGSANKVVKDSAWRDKWAREENITCFEMEAAGKFLEDLNPMVTDNRQD